MEGILDRFEENLAVILIESVQDEVHIEKEKLPEGSTTGTVFQMKKTSDTYRIDRIDAAATENRKQTSVDLMAKMRARKGSSRFKRNS